MVPVLVAPPGTSPRTRGKHAVPLIHLPQTRNIPAHAGKTSPSHFAIVGFREHPRARGENTPDNYGGSIIRGTSPRTRGKRPRWCAAPHPERGTSPRTRGKPAVTWCGLPKGRNIPAHAGKTPSKTTTPSVAQEHPRARGENAHLLRAYRIRIGTSPRTRGKRKGTARAGTKGRNIPAHAGKTLAAAAKASQAGEHPRARGENEYQVCFGRSVAGTSPRTRGKRSLPSEYRRGTGNIPAHAGKTTTCAKR